MPDGSEKWFGLKSRLHSSVVYDAGIDYKYMHEHSIKDRTGIFWDPSRGRQADMCNGTQHLRRLRIFAKNRIHGLIGVGGWDISRVKMG